MELAANLFRLHPLLRVAAGCWLDAALALTDSSGSILFIVLELGVDIVLRSNSKKQTKTRC